MTSRNPRELRVALIHYWLVNWRGGERVLRAIADLFPGCDIYTHVFDPEIIAEHFPDNRVKGTFISRLPMARRLYQKYLPLMPMALEQLDLSQYDLVISSESGPAKGVVLSPETLHVCYCHTPMRYVWDMYHEYRNQSGALTRFLMAPVMNGLRQWDQTSAQRVDHYVANSTFVAQRIKKYYRREAKVIYPPVEVADFTVATTSENFYLSVGQLVAYKKTELLVRAFNANGKRLVVIGEGECLYRLRKIARPNVELMGWQSSAVIRDFYARCRALMFPGVEDFGIVPVEAMATGKPVIAYARGGALETVIDGLNGYLFESQSVDGIVAAVDRFETMQGSFDPKLIRAQAEHYSTDRFKIDFRDHIADLLRTK